MEIKRDSILLIVNEAFKIINGDEWDNVPTPDEIVDFIVREMQECVDSIDDEIKSYESDDEDPFEWNEKFETINE